MAKDTIVKDVTELDRANLGGELRSDIAHILKMGELTFEMVMKKSMDAVDMLNGDEDVLKKLTELGTEYVQCRDLQKVLESEIKQVMNGNNVTKEVEEMQKKCYRLIDLDLDVLTRLELLMENALRSDDQEFEDLISRIKGFWKLEENREEGDPNQKLSDPQTRKRKRSETGGSVDGDIEGQVFACNEELEHVSGLVTKIRKFEESDRSENGDSDQKSMDLAVENEEIDQKVDTNQSGDLAVGTGDTVQKVDSQSGDPMDVEAPINIQQTEQMKIDEKGKCAENLKEEDEDEDEVMQKKSIESVLIDEIRSIQADAFRLGLEMVVLMSKKQSAETKFRQVIKDQSANKESLGKVISDRVIELKGLESEFKSLKSQKREHELEFADIVKKRITGVVAHEVKERLNQLIKN